VQTIAISVSPEQFEVATDLYYVNVVRQ